MLYICSMEHRDITLGWLVGIIDGEGCFYGRHAGQSKSTIILRFTIDASSEKMIDKVCEIFTLYDIKHRKSKRKNKQKEHHRQSYLVDIDTKQALFQFLKLVTPYLIVKKNEAIAIFNYLEKSCQVKRYINTEEDLQLVSKLKELKLLV